MSTPVPLPDLYFDSFSYPVASILFGDMVIEVIISSIGFFSQSQILSGKVQACSRVPGKLTGCEEEFASLV